MRNLAIVMAWLFGSIILASAAAPNPANAASTSIKCSGGQTVTVSTGSGSGSCSVEAGDPNECMSASGVCQEVSCTDGNKEGWGGCDGSGKAWCGIKGCSIKLVSQPRPPRRPPVAPNILDNNQVFTPSGPAPTGRPMPPKPAPGLMVR